MRILLISCHFAPYNSIGAIRPSQTARILVGRGHDVRVLTVKDQPYESSLPLPPELADRVSYVPYGGLERLVERFLGERRPGSPRVQAGRPVSRPGLRLLTWLKKAYRSCGRYPDRYGSWIRGAFHEGKYLFTTNAWKPDVIVATYPPLSAFYVGSRLAAWANVPWVADFRDVDSHRKPGAEFAWRERLDRIIEKKLLRNVAGMTTISKPLADALRRIHDAPCEVIMNGCDPDAASGAQDLAAVHQFTSDRVNIVYTGRGYPGKYDVSPLFRALVSMGGSLEQFAVWFYGREVEEYAQEARRFGLTSIVHCQNPVEYAQCRQIQRAADVLLLFQWNDPEVDGIIPAKFYEYIVAARPILAVGRPDTVLGAAIRDHTLGLASSDPQQIADWLMRTQMAKASVGKIKSVPVDATATFRRENQVERLEGFLECCVPRQTSCT